MNLVCFQGSDKEGWAQLNALIKRGDWEKIVVVKNNSTEDIPLPEKSETVHVNSDKLLSDLKQDIMEKLKTKIGRDFEVALSIASGTGKEHMALISALLSIPLGIRLVAFTKNGVEYLT